MNRKEQLEIFKAQVQNLRVLDKAWSHAKRVIHHDLVNNKTTSAALQTKVLALIYCAWCEVSLSKLIHTPHGFELSEIHQIKVANEKDIVSGWHKCIALSFRYLKNSKSNYIHNAKQKIERLVQTYIAEPRLVRNKIAHGQWEKALNRNNTTINQGISQSIADLDIVKLDRLRTASIGLSNIIEALIESPNKAFHRDYWIELTKLEQELSKSAGYTLESKIAFLKDKHSHMNL